MKGCWAGLGVVIAFFFAIGGCGSPDLTAVPTNATAPFVCDGVALAGAELILGGPATQRRAGGTWGESDRGFNCAVELESDNRRMILVSEISVESSYSGTEEGQLALMASQPDSEPIVSDFPGAGYVAGTDTTTNAGWVCNGRNLTVEPLRVGVEERNLRADAEAYLVSMLPWACGDEDPPKQTADE